MHKQIETYYENYDEEGRLFRDHAHQVEYLTTIRYFDQLLPPGSTILDACAGTGRYSFYLANKGHRVTACDLVPHNINLIKAKPQADELIDIATANVLDLSQFPDQHFDVVLCMGALYHLATSELREQAIAECVRVCRTDGIVVLAYITKIGIITAHINADASNMDSMLKIIHNIDDRVPFYCATPKDIDRISTSCRLEKLHHIGADGLAEVIATKINAATEENFQKYMEYHYTICEDESVIGTSLHGLWIGRKLR